MLWQLQFLIRKIDSAVKLSNLCSKVSTDWFLLANNLCFFLKADLGSALLTVLEGRLSCFSFVNDNLDRYYP